MWLDKLIGYVAPSLGESRIRARLRMEALEKLRDYDGAQQGRRRDGWFTRSTSANSETRRALVPLRDRARDLVRNNPYAAKAVQVHVDHLIGYGIGLQPKTGIEALDSEIKDAWEEWSETCDADGRYDFAGIQALVARTRFESGECLVRFRNRRSEDGLRVPMQLQVLEPDHLDATKDGPLSSGGYAVQGIEFDSIGRRVAYWLWTDHPGNGWFGARQMKSVRVPASEVLHVYRKDRPGQDRGVSDFAPILGKMRDLADYDEAELIRKQISATHVAFVIDPEGKSGSPLGEKSTEEDTGRILEKMSPGMIAYGKPGQDVRFSAPPGDTSFEGYMRTQLQAIASGLHMTYEQLTGDFSNVNYSSFRGARIEFLKGIESDQWRMIIPGLCGPVYRRFIDTAFVAGVVRKRSYRCEWTPPAPLLTVDPKKDAEADEVQIRCGLKTLSQAIRERGNDPDSQIKEIAETNKKLDALGVKLDSDARHADGTAGAIAQNTEVQNVSN